MVCGGRGRPSYDGWWWWWLRVSERMRADVTSGGDGAVVFRRAHAKLNLALSVGPTDPGNGLHPIASWFACVGLCDDVVVRRLGEVGGRVVGGARVVRSADGPCRVGLGETGGVDWPVESDLAVRAHAALERRIGASLPAAIEVQKRIPAGGGLGGGSSDAAAVLLALDEAFELGLRDDELAEVGAGLGSDVPYFVDRGGGHANVDAAAPRPAVVEGFGERIERTKRVSGGVVLIVPGFGCPTGPVYRAFDSAGSAVLDAPRVRRAVREAELRGVVDSELLFNDLSSGAIAVAPELGALIEMVSEAAGGRRVHVTGSGSTLFVLCSDDNAQTSALASDVRSALCAESAPEWSRRCAVVPTAFV